MLEGQYLIFVMTISFWGFKAIAQISKVSQASWPWLAMKLSKFLHIIYIYYRIDIIERIGYRIAPFILIYPVQGARDSKVHLLVVISTAMATAWKRNWGAADPPSTHQNVLPHDFSTLTIFVGVFGGSIQWPRKDRTVVQPDYSWLWNVTVTVLFFVGLL